jgi:superfamily II DNA or RNA helicase
VSERRRFSTTERTALYLAADGRCSNPGCGAELEAGWHSDHVTPWSRGGATDVVNGQALCPSCNLTKGDRLITKSRAWQDAALAAYLAAGKPDWLLSATPAAGKTRFSTTLARRLLDNGAIGQVIVVVPTDPLRLQWADNTEVRLRPITTISPPLLKAPYEGFIVTYQQVAGTAAQLLRRACAERPTLVIFDEIHHAGRDKAWGEGLWIAFEPAGRRVALTGTPWRRDNNPIPFIRYDANNLVVVDYAYEYGQAVREEVCRPIAFHAYTGEARWADCGKIVQAQVGVELDDEDAGAALEALYDPKHDWMPSLLQHAVAELDALRADVPDAAGLVIAERQWLAEEYAKLLRDLTGELPTLVISNDPAAKDKLDAFKAGQGAWIVAVRMVSEGVDIPRAAVGVYAAKTRTPLFFRQVVGRLVRRREGESHNATLFIPAEPRLMRYAKEIEDELRHALDLEREQYERLARDAEQQPMLNLRTPLSATAPEFDRAILRGQEYFSEHMDPAAAACREFGIPMAYVVNLAAYMNQHVGMPPAAGIQPQQTPDPEPVHRYETSLRQEIKALVGKIAYRLGGRDQAKEVNQQLLRDGFPPRDRASVAELERTRDHCVRWLGGLG